MRRSLLVFALCLLLCASAFPQSRGIIRCDPGMEKVPAWTAPGRAFVADQLTCGQVVGIVSLESGHMKIQIGERLVYVDAKYVALQQTQEPQTTPQTESGKQLQPQAQLPRTSGSAASQTVDAKKRVSAPGSNREYPLRHEGSLSFEFSNIYYDEQNFMRNKGFMSGASGDYSFRPNNLMLRLDGRISSGEVDYWSDGTGTAEDFRDYNFETRFSFGYDLKTASKKAVLTPYTGLGYRYLFDGSEGKVTSSGAAGYDRKSNYLYSPMGMEAMFRFQGGWSLGFSGEYDHLWHGWQYSELGDYQLVPYLIEVPNYVAKDDQEEGWGARGSLKFIKSLGRIDFVIEPYFRYWDIEDSDGFILYVIGYPNSPFGGYEPANSTTEWGAKLGIRF
jgi:hypothetical protein